MKRVITASCTKSSTQYPSRTYIIKYARYNIKCTILERKIDNTGDIYILRLEGNYENIHSFLNFLKYSGFRIH